MMGFSKIACTIAGLAALCLCAEALHAQENDEAGFYMGAAAGQARYQLDDGYYSRPFPHIIDVDQSSSTHSLYGGWQENRYLALELAYVDMGESNHEVFCPLQACVPEAVGPFQVSTRRADVAVLGMLPLGRRFELLGKLGIARAKHAITSIQGSDETEYQTHLLIGAGARFRFGAGWAIRAQWDRSKVNASPRSYNPYPAITEVDTIQLGVEFMFGTND